MDLQKMVDQMNQDSKIESGVGRTVFRSDRIDPGRNRRSDSLRDRTNGISEDTGRTKTIESGGSRRTKRKATA